MKPLLFISEKNSDCKINQLCFFYKEDAVSILADLLPVAFWKQNIVSCTHTVSQRLEATKSILLFVLITAYLLKYLKKRYVWNYRLPGSTTLFSLNY